MEARNSRKPRFRRKRRLKVEDVNVAGLDVTDEQMRALFDVPAAGWIDELAKTEEYFASIGDKVPAQLHEQLAEVRSGFEK